MTRDAGDYDGMPYESRSIPDAHPARMAAIASLLGLPSPALDRMRVLEIGCGSGGHLVPLAFSYPNARFVGIDLSAVHVAQAQTKLRALSLDNIEVVQGDISELEDSIEKFDFIICHGVYSWVSEDVRQHIFRYIGANLTEIGLGYVSYNTLPGWRPKQIIRDILLAEVAAIKDPNLKVAQARRVLDLLAELDGAPIPYGQALHRAARQVAAFSDSLLLHDILACENHPVLVTDFVRTAAGHGLSYVTDVDLASTRPDVIQGELGSLIRRWGAGDPLKITQAMDFLTGRPFRQALLMRSDRTVATKGGSTILDCLHLHVTGRLETKPNQGGDYLFCFGDPDGRHLQTNDVGLADALERFIARQPASCSLAQLLDEATIELRSRRIEDTAAVIGTISQGISVGIFKPTTQPVEIGARDTARPAVSRLVRHDAVTGCPWTVNLGHEPVALDDTLRRILPLIDGTRDRDTLAAELTRTLLPEVAVSDRGEQAEVLAGVLDGLRQDGLLMAT